MFVCRRTAALVRSDRMLKHHNWGDLIMADLNLKVLEKNESPAISDNLREKLTRQFADVNFTADTNKTMLSATLAAAEKTTDTLPSLTLVEDQLSPPKYFGVVPEVAAFSGALAMGTNKWLGAGLMVGAGGYQAYKDFGYLSQSDTLLQRSKFTGALLADTGMVSGGILTIAKVGPKWLAPSLMIGGFASRILLDMVPNRLGDKPNSNK